MKDRVRRYIKEQKLIEKGDRVLAAVSGGADSVCMLYLLTAYQEEIGYELYVVHINHGLRGKEADEDEAYVEQLCHKLGLHFHAYHIDVEAIARQEGLSTEEAGRRARYEVFEEECKTLRLNKVAVAHHMNDTAETVLFHLIRGTGIQGLTGIPARRNLLEGVEVIRPLLCVRREEVEAFLKQEGIEYCTDATNLTEDYSRNKLRNRVIPYIEQEMNDAAVSHICKASAHLYEINSYLNHMIDSVYSEYVNLEVHNGVATKAILSCKVTKEHTVIVKGIIRRILFELFCQGLKDISAEHVEQAEKLLVAQVGKRVNLPNDLIVKKAYEDVVFTFEEEKETTNSNTEIELNIHQPGEYFLKEIGKTLRVNVIDYKKNDIIPKNAYTKWFDYDKIRNTVYVRTRRSGDYFQVKEDGGNKKLKDYFIDRKIPREERGTYLLVADGSHIMWILSDRTSEAYKVDTETKKILVISLIGGIEDGYQR